MNAEFGVRKSMLLQSESVLSECSKFKYHWNEFKNRILIIARLLSMPSTVILIPGSVILQVIPARHTTSTFIDLGDIMRSGKAAADALLSSRRRSKAGKQPKKPLEQLSQPQLNESKIKYRTRVKILTIGSEEVGKSCIIKRFCEDRFLKRYVPTIGIDYGVKPIIVDGMDVRLDFFDLSGSPAYSEVRNEFYDGIGGALFVFDVTNWKSFNDLKKWSEEFRTCNTYCEVPVILCANKIDRNRNVPEEEGIAFAASHGMIYFEVSAQSGQNVRDIIHYLTRVALARTPIRTDSKNVP